MSKRYVLADDGAEQGTTECGTAAASDEITTMGRTIGYMYRDEPGDEHDSGWRFLSGDESQEYLDDEGHVDVVTVDAIAKQDAAIVQYLGSPPGTHLVRVDGSDEFVDADEEPTDNDWEEIDADAIDTLDDLHEHDDL